MLKDALKMQSGTNSLCFHEKLSSSQNMFACFVAVVLINKLQEKKRGEKTSRLKEKHGQKIYHFYFLF